MAQGAIPHQFNVPAPMIAIIPGVIAVAVGIHLIVADSAAWLGAVLIPVGAMLMMIGGVAKAVAWGISLERQHSGE
ncbi:hypothetical protein [Nocardioides yefusunii]|uniref:Uncharacterized protein n=1 Tax=Nocardioides yefusunii TaxID=2500546 RepID=A0ABW1QZI3_9ACTN|nr:hypothetical protein [Nocardioides yefusunii]